MFIQFVVVVAAVVVIVFVAVNVMYTCLRLNKQQIQHSNNYGNKASTTTHDELTLCSLCSSPRVLLSVAENALGKSF